MPFNTTTITEEERHLLRNLSLALINYDCLIQHALDIKSIISRLDVNDISIINKYKKEVIDCEATLKITYSYLVELRNELFLFDKRQE